MFEAEDFLDNDGFSQTPIRIAVRMAVDAEARTVTVDFAGSSPQVESSINAVYAITYSAVYYVFRCLLRENAPATAGLMRPVRVIVPEGSIVNARVPGPVAGGNVETSQRIVDTLLRALAQAAPDRVPAASAGTMSNLTIGGVDPRTHAPFTYYETTAGGMGAGQHQPGLPGVQTHMTNSLNTPVEALEFAYPFRVVRYGYRRGSGGAGFHRGGDGLVKELLLLADAEVTLLADRRRFAPYGLQGGEAGAPGRAALTVPNPSPGMKTHRAEVTMPIELPGKTSLRVSAGSVLRLETPGGGGWGEPPC
jgi:N-methylhydantoinase B